MSTPRQIKILDYRNGIYQGYLHDELFHGLGAILTEDFMFTMAVRSEGIYHGPTFTVFPSEKILYGDFLNNQPQGIFCYEVSNQCQFYFAFVKGKRFHTFASVFPNLQCILEVELTQDNKILSQKEYPYISFEEKWKKMGEIFNIFILDYLKSPQRFIRESFTKKFREIENVFGDQLFFGMKGEGLGVKFNLERFIVHSMGFYDSNKILKYVGKKYVNSENKVKQEGVYSKPQTLIRYLLKKPQQKKPQQIKKHLRDFFRSEINFQNRFISTSPFSEIQKDILGVKTILQQGTTKKIAQKLIEHLDGNDQLAPKYVLERPNRFQTEKQKNQQKISLQKLKEELNRSSHKKLTKSPYKTYQQPPAELKYHNEKIKYNQSFHNRSVLTDYSQPPLSPPRRPLRTHYGIITTSHNNKSPPSSFIEQPSREYRTSPRASPLVSPISRPVGEYRPIHQKPSPEHKTLRYNYIDQAQNNPQILQRTLTGTDLSSNNNYSFIDDLQPRPRKITPAKVNAQKLANLYDEMQGKLKMHQQQSSLKYNLNRGRGYQFHEEPLDKKMGLVRQPTKSRSPQQTYESTRDDLQSYSNWNRKYQRIESQKIGNQRKQFKYFDKNS